MFGTILKRVTVKVLDGVVERGKQSERAVVRLAADGLDRARSWVGLDHIDIRLVVPPWDGAQPDQPMWSTDRDKLHKWRMDRGIIKNTAAAPEATPVEPALKIFLKRGCPYCRAAVDLARERDIPFTQVDYSDDDDLRRAIRNQTGRRTSPHVFLHGKPIGGFDELRRLDESGELAKLLKAGPDAVTVAPREVAALELGDDDDDDEAEAEAEAAAKVAAKPAKPGPTKGTTFVAVPKRVKLPVIHPERSPFEDLLFPDAPPVDEARLEGDALIARVREVLEEVRPMVQSDGGDIELLDIQADIVGVRLTGNCIGCPSSQATLRQGIERKLKLRIPQIKGISSPQLQPGA